MTLPLSEEVRKARRSAVEADAAAAFHEEARSALLAVSVMTQRLASSPDVAIEIPGEDLIERAAARFPHLAPLHDVWPGSEAPAADRARARTEQLRSLQQLLAPISQDQARRAAEITRLQQEQARHLQEPAYAELRAAINERLELRESLRTKISALQLQRTTLQVPCAVIEGFLPTVGSDIDSVLTEPRHRVVAATKILAARDLIATHLAEHPLAPHVPKFSDPVLSRESNYETLAAGARALAELGHRVTTARDEILQQESDLEARFEEATQWILARTG